jgi:hypothetical protein
MHDVHDTWSAIESDKLVCFCLLVALTTYQPMMHDMICVLHQLLFGIGNPSTMLTSYVCRTAVGN